MCRCVRPLLPAEGAGGDAIAVSARRCSTTAGPPAVALAYCAGGADRTRSSDRSVRQSRSARSAGAEPVRAGLGRGALTRTVDACGRRWGGIRARARPALGVRTRVVGERRGLGDSVENDRRQPDVAGRHPSRTAGSSPGAARPGVKHMRAASDRGLTAEPLARSMTHKHHAGEPACVCRRSRRRRGARLPVHDDRKADDSNGRRCGACRHRLRRGMDRHTLARRPAFPVASRTRSRR